MILGIAPTPAAAPSVAALAPPALSQLKQLVSKYKADLSNDASTTVLSSLARQIATASLASGQHVELPKAVPEPTSVVAPVAPASAGKLNVAA